MTTRQVLIGLVGSRLGEEEVAIPLEAAVMAAFAGEEALAAALLDPVAFVIPSAAGSDRPPPVWLREITVAGFRGVGRECTLEVAAGPGLTLVVGRNGTGKSTFAEGLETALTGTNVRWERLMDHSKKLNTGWRNVHEGGSATRVRGVFDVEGRAAPLVVERTWTRKTRMRSGVGRVSWGEEVVEGGLESLGWSGYVDTCRPFLGYSEVGGLLERKPAELYDAVSNVLGLQPLVDAEKVLQNAKLERLRAVADRKKRRQRLLDALAESADPRARTLATLIADDDCDPEALSEAVTKARREGEHGAQLQTLERLAATRVPDGDEVEGIIERLRAAMAHQEDVAATEAQKTLEVAELLDHALGIHERWGDGPCPVCDASALDGEWAREAKRRRDELRGQAAESRRSRGQLEEAVRSAVQLCGIPLPRGLEASGLPAATDVAVAIEAWRDGARLQRPTDLMLHLGTQREALFEAVGRLRTEAGAALAGLERQWMEVAGQVAAWVPELEKLRLDDAQQQLLKRAEKWLANEKARLREARFRPIADEQKRIWETLRAGSRVTIDGVALEGNKTQRRVELIARIDGTPGVALSVMSQGELHAFALSLFLPRMTWEESPFRFFLLDDPVQAMDPHKVDGLARLLGEIATARQVVVFTHDVRLVESVRRLRIAATILEVERAPRSVVSLRHRTGPVEQHLDDARAVLGDAEGLGESLTQRLVPGFLRQALEAAFTQALRRRWLAHGEVSHAELERRLEGATKLADLCAWFVADKARVKKLEGKVAERLGPDALACLETCQAGAHAGYPGDLKALTKTVRRLCRTIAEAK